METFKKECDKLNNINKYLCTKKYCFYIHLHIYYREQTYFLLSLIENLKINFFLIITISGKENYSLFKELSRFQSNYLDILYVQNYGFDIYPFLNILPRVKDDNAIIAKLHTKTNQEIVGGNWRRECLRSLFYSDHYVKDVLMLFKNNPDLYMLGSSTLYKSTEKFMYENHDNFLNLLQEMDLSSILKYNQSMGFFAGSMFWAKKEAFIPILNVLPEIYNISLAQSNNTNPSIWHAVERLFGVLPRLQNKNTYTVKFNRNKNYNICYNPNPSFVPLTQSF